MEHLTIRLKDQRHPSAEARCRISGNQKQACRIGVNEIQLKRAVVVSVEAAEADIPDPKTRPGHGPQLHRRSDNSPAIGVAYASLDAAADFVW